MSQLILSEVEHRYPEGVLVAIEEEPRILNGIVVAHDMQFSGRRIALGAHNGDLITFPCHINHYQRMPHALQLAGRIDKHIARLYLTDRSRLCLPVYRERAARSLMVMSAHCSELLSIGKSITPVDNHWNCASPPV